LIWTISDATIRINEGSGRPAKPEQFAARAVRRVRVFPALGLKLPLADATDDLAKCAGDGSVQYQDFAEILGLLHAAGFFPLNGLVSDVAMALER